MPINQSAVEEVDGEDITPGSVDTDGSVATGQLLTEASGVIMELNGDQTIADTTNTEIQWKTAAVERGSYGFADTANNGVTVPSGDWSYIKLKVGLRFLSETDLTKLFARKEGTILRGCVMYLNTVTPQKTLRDRWETAWIPVTTGDTFTVEVEHSTGSSRDINDIRDTYMEVQAI